MMKDKFIRVYSNEQVDSEIPMGYRIEQVNPKFFVRPRTTVDYAVTTNEKIATAYAAVAPNVKVVSDLSEILGTKTQEQPVQKPVQPPEPDEPTPIETPTPETVQKETDHLTHDEIRSAPFFTQKKMVKEKYGVVAKNKDEIEAVLADNE